MSNPQQPELARSRKTPAQDQDAVAGVLDGQREIGTDAPRGPVPPENQPGHHPAQEQDKPDLNAFAERLGTLPESERTETPDDARDTSNARPTMPPVLTQAGGRRSILAGVGALAALVLAVVAGRRLRSRRGRRSR